MQQNFEINLVKTLSHSIVYFTREEYSPGGIVDDARNGGDPPAPSVAASSNEQLNALATYLPTLIQAVGNNIPGLEEALFQSRSSISPKDNALQLKLLQEFGPAFNEIGNQITKQNQLSQVGADTAALKSAKDSGLISGVSDLDRTINPEFYTGRASGLKGLEELLSSFSGGIGGGLSGSERAEIERSINRDNIGRGNDRVSSPIKTVENAMRFGSAGQNRLNTERTALGTAIDKASSFLPSSRANIDPFQLATGKPSGPNVGQTQFGGVTPVGKDTLNLTSGLLGQTGENVRTGMGINANRRDELDRYNETASTTSSLLGSICCWIFLESYNGKLPWFVRVGRDFHYKNEPKLAVGYRRMAIWLVPLMRKYKLVRFLVNHLMVKPMACYGGWMFNIKGFEHGKRFSVVQSFWFNIWRLMSYDKI